MKDTAAILAEWKEDHKFRFGAVSSSLTHDITNTPVLQNKYLNYLVEERNILRKLEADYSTLRRAKYELYDQGHTKKPKKWVDMPAKGAATSKKELELYIDSDPEILAFAETIGNQKDKIMVIEDIRETLKNRSYLLRNLIDWQKFERGE